MKRRDFLRALALGPFAGLVGVRAPVVCAEVDVSAFAPSERHSIVADRLWEQFAPPVVTGDGHLIHADDLPNDNIRLLYNRPCVVNLMIDGKRHRVVVN